MGQLKEEAAKARGGNRQITTTRLPNMDAPALLKDLEAQQVKVRPELEDQLAVMLGGRAAEEIIYEGVVSTGAANDLERASELRRQTVTRFGMSERLGRLTYGRPGAARFL